jgi:hypothetical protein
MPEGYKARVERVMLIKVLAWDVNCPQHIPQKIDGGRCVESACDAGCAYCASRLS